MLNFFKYKVHIGHLRLKLPIKQTLNAVCLLDSVPVMHYGNEWCLIFKKKFPPYCVSSIFSVQSKPYVSSGHMGPFCWMVLWDCRCSLSIMAAGTAFLPQKCPVFLFLAVFLSLCATSYCVPAAELLPLENCCLCGIFHEREGVRVWEEGGSVVWLYGDVPSGRCGDGV